MRFRLRGPDGYNRDFFGLWSAQTISTFGSQVTSLALPLAAILVLKASTFEVAALAFMNSLPLILFALPAGVWVDRLPRKPVMVIADLGRALVLGSVPLAYVFDALTLAQLYVVAFVAGTLTAFFDVAYQSFLPALVKRESLGEANARLEISRSGAQVVGPSLAGLLVAAITAPYAILADALSFVGSASFLARIRRGVPEKRATGGPASMRQELREGLRFVLRHPILRPNLTYTGTANIFNAIVFAVLLLYAVRELHISTAKVGLLFSGASVGSLVAASFAPRIQRRVGVGRTMLVAAFSGWALIVMPFAHGILKIPMLVVPLSLWSFGAVVYNVSSVSLSQAVTPDRLMARMNASRRLVAWGTLPPATLLGGLLGTYFGLRTAVLIGATGRALSGLIILLSPVRNIRVLGDADALVESFNVEFMGDEQPGYSLEPLQ